MARATACVLAIFALIGYIYCAHTGETDCQRRRRTEQRATRNLTGLLVPECDDHGEYKAIQCFGETVRGRPFCACYDREFGQIKGPSRSLRSCNCIRAHHEWERSRGSDHRESEPQCDTTSGEYNAVQCSSNEHWCVDRDTGVPLGQRERGGCSTDLSHVSCGIGDSHHGYGDRHNHTTGRGGSSHDHDTSHHGSGSRTRGSSHHDDDDTSHHSDSGSRSGSGSRTSSSGSRSGSSSHSDSDSHHDSGSHSGSSTSHRSDSGH